MKIPDCISNYTKDEKLNVYKIFLDFFPNILVGLKNEFIINIRKKIYDNHSSLMDFARINNFHYVNRTDYTPLKHWLKLNKKTRSFIPIKQLLKLCNIFKISQEDVIKNITSFGVKSGNRITLPKYIPIDYDLFYSIGLYFGEGKNKDKEKTRVSISNSNLDIVEFVIHWFDNYFNIDKNDLKYYSVIPFTESEGKIRNKLSERLNINKNTIFFSRRGDQKRNVVVQVTKDSKVLRLLVEWIKENLLFYVIEDKKASLAFIQGLFDGEGFVTSHNPEVHIEMKDTFVLDIVEYILLKEGIDPNRTKNNTVIVLPTRCFPKLKKFIPFRLNKKRLNKCKGYLKDIGKYFIQPKRNGTFLSILRKLHGERNKWLTIEQITLLCNYKGRTATAVVKRLKEYLNQNYVKRIGRGTKKHLFQFKITSNGSSYIDDMESEHKEKIERLKSSIVSTIAKGWNYGCSDKRLNNHKGDII